MSNQGKSSSSSGATAQLSAEDRRAITLGLCEHGNAQMLTDAGRAAQKARYVGGGKLHPEAPFPYILVANPDRPIQTEKPVRKPVNAHTYEAATNNGDKGQGK
ncbi:MAG: hypothetical protein LQ346_004194 [Caloplaca aetnensis]|nr:MAG: hypothetical protein LQ346_004194 [Caloplaca aetnensis]